MRITVDKNGKAFLVGAGKRVRVSVTKGPWVGSVPPELIKVRPRVSGLFPKEIRDALAVENNSDMTIDYFEKDCIRLMPGDALYDMAASVPD